MSRRKTLEQLKENVIESFNSYSKISESVTEKYREMLTESKQAYENIKKAKNRKERLEAEIECNNLRINQMKMEYDIQRKIHTSQWKIIKNLLLYVSALENYASIWDSRIDIMKKIYEKFKEATKQWEREKLRYIS